MFFICKNYIFSNFTLNKKFCSSKWWGGGVERHCPFFLYGPAFIIDFRQTSLTLTDFTDRRPITSFKRDSSTGILPWILQNFEKKTYFANHRQTVASETRSWFDALQNSEKNTSARVSGVGFRPVTWIVLSKADSSTRVLCVLFLNHCMCLLKDTENETFVFNKFIFDNSEEKILGITIYNKLTFESYIKTLCKNAARKIGDLSRLLNHLMIPRKDSFSFPW